MAAVALNRILIVLGFVGTFIAGFLSLSHLLNISLPCGITKGCDIVATHPTSYLTGNPIDGGIPVAYLGFVAYLFLTLIAVLRAVRGVRNSKALVTTGFIVSGIGALYSGYLTYTALYVIQATCIWCISSAITMIVTTIVYAALQAADKTEEEPSNSPDLLLAGVMTLVVGIGLGAGIAVVKAKGGTVDRNVVDRIVKDKLDLLAPGVHIYGNPDAPITIIEFADMLCPACQKTFKELDEIVKNSNGKLNLAFRHFPLFMKEDHKMALPAATIAEIAAEENKFFQFVAAMYSRSHTDLQTPEAVFAVAKSVGMDVSKLEARLNNEADPAVKRVTDDMNLANKIKISITPTLFIKAKGKEVEQIAFSRLQDKLSEEPYKSLMAG
ncbi:MAG: vitamin K epoxide reductase family protein, partial [Chlorobia bacterium]|nr:vitamin K epoxide reductase family protein [Fimbriimonadaceae bacterium]